jgi:transposase InsO family protein
MELQAHLSLDSYCRSQSCHSEGAPQYQRRHRNHSGKHPQSIHHCRKSERKWLTDVTEFKCGNGEKLYLSAILDLKGRDIVSFAWGVAIINKLVFDTFDLAILKHPTARPIFHSDRGFQYTSKLF